MKVVMRKHFVPNYYLLEQRFEELKKELIKGMHEIFQTVLQPIKKTVPKTSNKAKPTNATKEIASKGEREVHVSSSLSSKENLEILATGYLLNSKKSPSVQTKAEEDVQREKLAPTRYQQYGVIHSILVKEKPPCSLQHFPTQAFTVSRTKLFQEGGYDMILTSSSHESSKRIGPAMKPKEEPPDFNFKTINGGLSIRPTTTWNTCSPHLEHSSKLNQSNQNSGEEVIQLSTQAIPSLRDLDMRAFQGGFRTNQKESSNEPNFPRILILQRSCEIWKHLKICSDLKDMDFTNRWNCLRPYYASRPKIVFHSPTQEQYRHETTWGMLMDLSSVQQAQEQKESQSDAKDTLHFPRWVNLVLNLKSSRPNWFASSQTYVWHRGGISTKPSKPRKPQKEHISTKEARRSQE